MFLVVMLCLAHKIPDRLGRRITRRGSQQLSPVSASATALISRVLAEEGIGYRSRKPMPARPARPWFFFADTTKSKPDSILEDVSPASDTIHSLGGVRGQPIARVHRRTSGELPLLVDHF
jgi:hypothetical protein